MNDSPDNSEKKEFTRRSFLKMATGTGLLIGLAGTLTGCSEQVEYAGGKGWLPYQYNIAGNLPAQVRGRVPIDADNPSIIRNDRKCILCGQCLEVCKNIESVYGYYDLPIIDETICINCGQCSMACPTGAISERDDTGRVFDALADKNRFVVVQTAPATRVSLGEEFGLPAGTWIQGKQVAALRRLGFDAVLDTNFTADLTIMEEATELIKRIKGEGEKALPQLTSCSPGWIKFCEYFYPELIPNISSCKSPQQMFGALAKTYYATAKKIDPGNIFSVSIMPCTAKKFEAQRPEMNAGSKYWKRSDLRDVDAVLTTRELARMLKKSRIDLTTLPDEEYDNLMGEETGAAVIFAATGGVMEAAARTAYFLITGNEPPQLLLNLTPVRGLAGVKEAAAEIPGVGTLRVAVSHGMANGRKVLDAIRKGNAPWHFVEIMTCPGGCIAGGGQPRTAVPPTDAVREQRLASIYKADASLPKRKSYENAEVAALYRDFLKHPMSELSEELLHTEYHSRAGKVNSLSLKIV